MYGGHIPPRGSDYTDGKSQHPSHRRRRADTHSSKRRTSLYNRYPLHMHQQALTEHIANRVLYRHNLTLPLGRSRLVQSQTEPTHLSTNSAMLSTPFHIPYWKACTLLLYRDFVYLFHNMHKNLD